MPLTMGDVGGCGCSICIPCPVPAANLTATHNLSGNVGTLVYAPLQTPRLLWRNVTDIDQLIAGRQRRSDALRRMSRAAEIRDQRVTRITLEPDRVQIEIAMNKPLFMQSTDSLSNACSDCQNSFNVKRRLGGQLLKRPSAFVRINKRRTLIGFFNGKWLDRTLRLQELCDLVFAL